MSALAGRSVVVTRPREQAGTLATALRACGANPVFFPTIEVRGADPAPLDRAIAQLERYDWLMFTSANAVRFFGERLSDAGCALPAALRVAAVGPATAAALAERGLRVDALPDRFVGTRLAAALGRLDGKRVLLPRADIGREETVDALRRSGATVDDVIAYHTVPPVPDPEGVRRLAAGVDAILFTSPSTVRNFMQLLGSRAPTVLAATVRAAIGPVTAAALAATGFPAHVEPAEYSAPGLVAALETYFGSRAACGAGDPV